MDQALVTWPADWDTVRADAKKTPPQWGKPRVSRTPFRDRKTGHEPHQPAIGSEVPVDMIAEVPLTGLSL